MKKVEAEDHSPSLKELTQSRQGYRTQGPGQAYPGNEIIMQIRRNTVFHGVADLSCQLEA